MIIHKHIQSSFTCFNLLLCCYCFVHVGRHGRDQCAIRIISMLLVLDTFEVTINQIGRVDTHWLQANLLVIVHARRFHNQPVQGTMERERKLGLYKSNYKHKPGHNKVPPSSILILTVRSHTHIRSKIKKKITFNCMSLKS